ncbi:MAG TPA: tRNA glutamyl-Q(34) synthetase GluQRS [Gallionella sp.]|nr:tRNA glutamyl-Q(34) synthetase GluQRS [Gallionella sp.]
MPFPSQYRGRFAPSPTGPLHFGSLVAAVGSYLDARHHQGKWLVRIEDLDTPRTVTGAADDILGTLVAHGLYWDEEIIYQSRRTAAYESAFHRLKQDGSVYPCCCTRKEIADSALHGVDGQIYPGTCRNGIPAGREARAWRVRTDHIPSPLVGEGARERGRLEATSPSPQPSPIKGEGVIKFNDALQGRITQHLEKEIGDFVVKRADGLFAYQLAVVVDDAAQGVTNVVRGADLLYSTPRQIYLQHLLGLPTTAYMHLPVAVNAQGEKLSKQTLARPVEKSNAVSTLFDALVFLRQYPPAELRLGTIEEMLAWAAANWQPQRLSNCLHLTA